MPVANAKDICDDTVPSAGADVSVHGFFTHAQWASLIWIVGTEVGEDGPAVFLTYSREGDGGNKLDSASKGRGGEDTVGCEFKVKIFFQEQIIHEGDDLDDELVLAQVVAGFE